MGAFTRPEPLGPYHDVESFDCGSPAQTDWLHRAARVAQAEGTSRVYVTCLAGSSRVAGYFAMASGAVTRAEATDRVLRRAGAYPAIPVVILTRLGVDQAVQGQGLGRALVRDAFLRVEQAADVIGVRALLVHAESESARAFYLAQAEFEPSPTDPLHLLLLVRDIRAALRAGQAQVGQA